MSRLKYWTILAYFVFMKKFYFEAYKCFLLFFLGEHTRLIPIDQGPEIRQKVTHFRTEIDKIPANVITVGSFFNPEFCTNLKYPFFIPSVRNHLKGKF